MTITAIVRTQNVYTGEVAHLATFDSDYHTYPLECAKEWAEENNHTNNVENDSILVIDTDLDIKYSLHPEYIESTMHHIVIWR